MAESIDSLVKGQLTPKSVPHAEFVRVVYAILSSLETDQEELPRVFEMIRVEADSTAIVVACTYNVSSTNVPIDMYEAAVRTLKWINNKKGNYSLPPSINNFRRTLHGRKTTPAEPVPETIEEKVKQEPNKRTRPETRGRVKQEKRDAANKRGRRSKIPDGFRSYTAIKKIVEKLHRTDTYNSLADVDEELARREVCEEGELLKSQTDKTALPIAVYTELLRMDAEESQKMIEDARKKREAPAIPDGHVPYFAFAAIVKQIIKNRKCRSFSELESTLEKHSICRKGAIHNIQRDEKSCPGNVYDALVFLLTYDNKDPPNQNELHKIRTPQTYDSQETYQIGQILKLHRCWGVVVAKPGKNKILVVKEDNSRNGIEKAEPNPQIYVEGVPIDPRFKKTSNDFEIW